MDGPDRAQPAPGSAAATAAGATLPTLGELWSAFLRWLRTNLVFAVIGTVIAFIGSNAINLWAMAVGYHG